jgi:glutamate-ammonia-ligase adenylyltransferase
MVHGRTDEEVRQPTTLSALARLTERGYVGREDGRSLHDAYAFLRVL